MDVRGQIPKSGRMRKMRTNMKRLLALLLACAALLSLSACSDTGAKIQKTKAAQECIANIFQSPNVNTLRQYLTADSYDVAEEIWSVWQSLDPAVEIEYIGKYEAYDVFSFAAKYRVTGEEEGCFILLKEENGSYKLCANEDVLLKAQYDIVCNVCAGSGQVQCGGQVCGICGGTGQQYIPNAYYDGFMWQGLWQACAGCGGAGWFGVSFRNCAYCAGDSLRLKK